MSARRCFALLGLLICTTLLASCGSGGGSNFAFGETTPPEASAEGGVAVAGEGGDMIIIGFSEAMDEASVEDPDNYTLENPEGNFLDLSGADFDYVEVANSSIEGVQAEDEFTLTITLQEPLTFGEEWILTINGAQDEAGNNIADNTEVSGTVTGDGTGPDTDDATLTSEEGELGDTLTVDFTEDVDEDTATNVNNYTLHDDTLDAFIALGSVTYNGDSVTIDLNEDIHTANTFTVTVEDVEDLAGNVMDPNPQTITPVTSAGNDNSIPDITACLYLDVDFSGTVNAGDQLVLTFDSPVTIDGNGTLDDGDFEFPANGGAQDTLGAAPAIDPHGTDDDKLVITLGGGAFFVPAGVYSGWMAVPSGVGMSDGNDIIRDFNFHFCVDTGFYADVDELPGIADCAADAISSAPDEVTICWNKEMNEDDAVDAAFFQLTTDELGAVDLQNGSSFTYGYDGGLDCFVTVITLVNETDPHLANLKWNENFAVTVFAGIRDANGNELDVNEPCNGVVDGDDNSPFFTGATFFEMQGDGAAGPGDAVVLVFDENMDIDPGDFDPNDLTLSGGSLGSATVTFDPSSDPQQATVTLGSGATLDIFGGVTINGAGGNDSIEDEAGNALDTGTPVAIINDDNTQPMIDSVSGFKVEGGEDYIEVLFDETMANIAAITNSANYIVESPNGFQVDISSVDFDGDSLVTIYIDLPDFLTSGANNVKVNVTGFATIVDANGNPLTGPGNVLGNVGGTDLDPQIVNVLGFADQDNPDYFDITFNVNMLQNAELLDPASYDIQLDGNPFFFPGGATLTLVGGNTVHFALNDPGDHLLVGTDILQVQVVNANAMDLDGISAQGSVLDGDVAGNILSPYVVDFDFIDDDNSNDISNGDSFTVYFNEDIIYFGSAQPANAIFELSDGSDLGVNTLVYASSSYFNAIDIAIDNVGVNTADPTGYYPVSENAVGFRFRPSQTVIRNLSGVVPVADYYDLPGIMRGVGQFGENDTAEADAYDIAGNKAWDVVTGDWNKDGAPDIAVCSFSNTGATGTVSILLNDGDGGMIIGEQKTLGQGLLAIASGDFNMDEDMDVVVTSINNNSIYVLYGNGDGTFSNGTAFACNAAPYGIVTGKFAGEDGDLDLAVTNYTEDRVTILRNNGNGAFSIATTIAVGDGPVGIFSGYIGVGGESQSPIEESGIENTEIFGDDDLIVCNYDGNTITVIHNNGDDTFTVTDTLDVRDGDTNEWGPYDVVIWDANHDYSPDIAVTCDLGNAVVNFFGLGGGDFDDSTENMEINTVENDEDDDLRVRGIVAGNFNDFNDTDDDMPDDLIFTCYGVYIGDSRSNEQPNNEIGVALNDQSPEDPIPFFQSDDAGFRVKGIAVADFDGDGRADIVVTTFDAATNRVVIQFAIDIPS